MTSQSPWRQQHRTGPRARQRTVQEPADRIIAIALFQRGEGRDVGMFGPDADEALGGLPGLLPPALLHRLLEVPDRLLQAAALTGCRLSRETTVAGF